MTNLRPAQQKVLAYTDGYMAVSAVPGSGKTFTLTRLAVELVLRGNASLEKGQQILIVTYLNTSVANFKKGIYKRLKELDYIPEEYEHFFDVRTLHSLGLEILRYAGIGDTLSPHDPIDVSDETRFQYLLSQAVDGWIDTHKSYWEQFLPNDTPSARVQWRQVTQDMARNFINTAKNEQYTPEAILAQIEQHDADLPWVWMLAGIYQQYQRILHHQGTYDFNDLILQALQELNNRPDLVEALGNRWTYILEDEAQDSVPLQEYLLTALTQHTGNLVRVGDPNQAITTTFTTAHPRYFREFMQKPSVHVLSLPNSGRCAPLIFGAANELVRWTCDQHPIPAIRTNTFHRQFIQPTPPDDSQPNPTHLGQGITIQSYKNVEEEELPAIADLATRYLRKYPDHSLAILVPTNRLGHALMPHLDHLKANYDSLLKGGLRVREVATSLHTLLAILATPLQSRYLLDAYQALEALQHPVTLPPLADNQRGRFEALLRSIFQPENFLFPLNEEDRTLALPATALTDQEQARLTRFAHFLHDLFQLRSLPIADLTLTLSDKLFAPDPTTETDLHQHERDLDVAYQIAHILQRWQDTQPTWRLPELVTHLENVAKGYQSLSQKSYQGEDGYEPAPGQITLATQHSAKGLEWDSVFLVGVTNYWFPDSLDDYFKGGYDVIDGEDPTANVLAQLHTLMQGNPIHLQQTQLGDTPTDSAHLEIISERLRLLYVCLTRARRYLHISYSRDHKKGGRSTGDSQARPLSLDLLTHYLQHT